MSNHVYINNNVESGSDDYNLSHPTANTANASTGITIYNAIATNQNTTATNNAASTGITINNNTTGISATSSNTGSGASFSILNPIVYASNTFIYSSV